MKIITYPNPQQEDQLNISIQKAKEYINAYKKQPDSKLLREKLCEVIDECPNVGFFDPDWLSCFGIEEDDSQWVEFEEDEMRENNIELKRVINDVQFDCCNLSFMGSGSILLTIFGDAYDEIGGLSDDDDDEF